MKVYGISIDELHNAAMAAGVTLKDPEIKVGRNPYITTAIRPKDETFKRVDHITKKKIFAVDVYGHGAFMISIFEINPNARIESSTEKFNGLKDFTEKLIDVLEARIGNQRNPIRAFEAATEISDKAWNDIWLPKLRKLAVKNGFKY